MTKRIPCHCKCKFNGTACNSDQKLYNKTYQWGCKNYRICKKDYIWNPSAWTCENSKYLESIAETSVITCDEIIAVTNIVSTKMINTVAISTTSITYHSKKVRYKIDCNILHTGLLVIILLLIIAIISYHYAKNRSKQKGVDAIIT